ncbi:MAG: putative exported protein [Frondihabitans sp.]|nr:putative exported protein [Frondihabitans sp.]
MRITQRKISTRGKIFAILSAGLVVGVGATMTFASWTDTEWAFGGNGAGGPGVGTSSFSVEQHAGSGAVATVNALTGFANFTTNPGDPLTFSPGALSLSPGDVTYAPVALRTTSTSVQGTLQLEAAVPAANLTTPVVDPGSLLFNALTVNVSYFTTTGTATNAPSCDAAGFATYTPIVLTGAGLGAVPATGTQAVAAASGSTVHYCFQISLPAGAPATLEGRTAAPAWLFSAVSN